MGNKKKHTKGKVDTTLTNMFGPSRTEVELPPGEDPVVVAPTREPLPMWFSTAGSTSTGAGVAGNNGPLPISREEAPLKIRAIAVRPQSVITHVVSSSVTAAESAIDIERQYEEKKAEIFARK
jgi:hypothetical protein